MPPRKVTIDQFRKGLTKRILVVQSSLHRPGHVTPNSGGGGYTILGNLTKASAAYSEGGEADITMYFGDHIRPHDQ